MHIIIMLLFNDMIIVKWKKNHVPILKLHHEKNDNKI
jgi:hypothetical protein